MNTLPFKAPSARTKARTFRITHTQAMLLDQRIKSSSSALVRVLLNLYFNKKLDKLKIHGIDIESLLRDEIKNAQEAILKNGDKFRNMLKAQSTAKQNGTF